jgi:hypothetical protein
MKYNPQQIISAVGILLLVLISSVGTPSVPKFIVNLFNNTVFKILYMTAILFVFHYNPVQSLFLAVIFLLVLQTINNYQNYIDTTTDKLNVKNLTSGLINSAKDSVSEVVSDTGSIITSVFDSVVDVANFGNDSFTNPEKEEFDPAYYDNLPDQYNGPKFEHSLGHDFVVPKFMDSTVPQPMNQYEVDPDHGFKSEDLTKSTHATVNSPTQIHPELQKTIVHTKKSTKH